MTERTATLDDGISLAYETFGDPSDPTLLLVMGLGCPLNWWRTPLCEELAAQGFHVVRFDTRDVGRSTRFDDLPVSRAQVAATFSGLRRGTPYAMSDLAADAAGLLDALDVDAAHVVGQSMGGMVAQTLAVEHPDRVRSLTSIMSTTGRRSVGWQHPRLASMLLAAPGTGEEGYVRRSMRSARAISSRRYGLAPEAVEARARETYARGWSIQGTMRHMLAVMTQPDRTRALGAVRVPTLVIHGSADPMVHPSGGRATAAAVPGAELLVVPGMAHEIPVALEGLFATAIARTARRSHAHAR
ncbi:alpha/beta fold hydrolase [Mumia sp. DW29H23]|uniref:alpha/beta fold hydrolase n=1 Tax=Mumia sp. DW29H23 TaxID=3421241 RepID=UPI003D680B94